MAQHDYQIPDADGTMVRLNLSAALQALGTFNAGPFEPPSPAPRMLWFDTDANAIKQRSADNREWYVVWALGAATEPGAVYAALDELRAASGGITFYAHDGATMMAFSADGDVTLSGSGNLTGDLEGTADSMDRLARPVEIAGRPFDGSSDLTGIRTSDLDDCSGWATAEQVVAGERADLLVSPQVGRTAYDRIAQEYDDGE